MMHVILSAVRMHTYILVYRAVSNVQETFLLLSEITRVSAR